MADKYTRREKALMTEAHEVEAILAEALGYTHDEQYGWVIGDHTPVTLAMEVRSRGVRPRAKTKGLGSLDTDQARQVQAIFDSTTWQCPHCNDWYGQGDEDKPPVCDMCKKAGRT